MYHGKYLCLYKCGININVLYNSVGGLAGAVCTSPLDVVKTRLQVTIGLNCIHRFDLYGINDFHYSLLSTNKQ